MMKSCPKCGVSVEGALTRCPLCQGKLTGKPTPPLYPALDGHISRLVIVAKLLAFITFTGAVVSIGVNIITYSGVKWSLYVLLGVACFWVSFLTVLKKKNNIPKTILYQTFIISALSVVWDLFVGWHGWSIDYVIPIACIIAMISMFVIGRVLKLNQSDYIIFIFIDSIFSLLPVVFYLTGLLNIIIPSIICMMLSLISLAGVFIFISGEARREFVKRFHI